MALMVQTSQAGGGFALDNGKGQANSLFPTPAVLFRLCPQVVHIVEVHLFELADPCVKVTRNGNVEDQGQPVAPRTLHTPIWLEQDNWLGSRGGADHHVSLD